MQNQACTCICIHTHSRVHLIYMPHTQKHMYANILEQLCTLNVVYSLDGTQNILHWNSRILFNTPQLTFKPLQHILAWWCSKDIPQKCMSLAYFWHTSISYHIHFQSTPHTHAMILKGHCICWAAQWRWFAWVNALCNLSRKRSREVAASLPGRFLSRRCFTLCITMEVEPRIAKQFKCHHCCSCKNYRGKGMEGEKKVYLRRFSADQKIAISWE